jgi:hypothetical protein
MNAGKGKTRAKRQRMHLGAGDVLQVGDLLAESSWQDGKELIEGDGKRWG